MTKLKVLEYEINTKTIDNENYISLTDLARYKNRQDTFLIINQ